MLRSLQVRFFSIYPYVKITPPQILAFLVKWFLKKKVFKNFLYMNLNPQMQPNPIPWDTNLTWIFTTWGCSYTSFSFSGKMVDEKKILNKQFNCLYSSVKFNPPFVVPTSAFWIRLAFVLIGYFIQNTVTPVDQNLSIGKRNMQRLTLMLAIKWRK